MAKYDFIKNLHCKQKTAADDAFDFAKKPSKGIKAINLILDILSFLNAMDQKNISTELKRRAVCQ